MKVSTREKQHQGNVRRNNNEKSGIVLHARKCNKGIEWETMKTLKVQPRRFDRKVREALEIQYYECGPKKGGMNLDDGQYVKTKFWTPLFKYLRNKQCDVSNDHTATSNNTVTLQRPPTDLII